MVSKNNKKQNIDCSPELLNNKSMLDKHGHSDVLSVFNEADIEPIQILIYELTKEYILAENDNHLTLNELISSPFKRNPEESFWSDLMTTVNNSKELNELLNHEKITNLFDCLLGEKTELFPVNFFRAVLGSEKRSVYNWHQDQGTWYLSSNNKKICHALPRTLWLSINGADKNNSIILASDSHENHLYDHRHKKGQGYFSANVNYDIESRYKCIIPEVKPGQGVMFSPFLLHRSVPAIKKFRYSIDIRYNKINMDEKYSISFNFRLKKLLKQCFN